MTAAARRPRPGAERHRRTPAETGRDSPSAGASSIRLMRRRTAQRGCRVVRPSIAHLRPLACCATCGVTSRSRIAATKSRASSYLYRPSGVARGSAPSVLRFARSSRNRQAVAVLTSQHARRSRVSMPDHATRVPAAHPGPWARHVSGCCASRRGRRARHAGPDRAARPSRPSGGRPESRPGSNQRAIHREGSR